MLYNIYNKDTFLLPSVHGWRYVNDFGFGIALGMCYTVLDRFYNGIVIPDITGCPNDGSTEWQHLHDRQSIILTPALESEINSWTALKTDQNRMTESWNLLDTLDSINTPVILMVISGVGSNVDQDDAVYPVLLHHFTFVNSDTCRLFVYDPYVSGEDFISAPEEEADNTVIQISRNGYGNGAIGLNNRGSIYGIFQWPYNEPIVVPSITSSVSMVSVSREVHTNTFTDLKHRLDTVRISLNWNGNVIPYHSLKIDNNDALLSYTEGDFSSLDDLAVLHGTGTSSSYGQSDTRLRYLLNSASGEKLFDAKLIIDTNTYASREIRVDFPGETHRVDYTPQRPEMIKTFFTLWPDYFEYGYADSDKVYGLTSDQVTVREDYDESIHGEIPPEQTVYVKGSKALEPWDINAPLAVNLFGAGLAFGFIKEKISCAKRTLRFLNREEGLHISYWIHSTPDSAPAMLVERHQDVTDIENFCLNDILAGNSATPPIRDGFTDQDFDRNSYIDVYLECEDEVGQRIEKETRLWVRNRLMFTGIEPPHLKYVQFDLRTWILGPYLRRSIFMLDLINVRKNIIRGAARHRESVENAISGVLKNFDRIDKTDQEIIYKTIADHRRMMIRDYDSLLRKKRKINTKVLNEELRSIRESRYRILMNSLSEIVLGIVKKGKLK